MQNLREIDFVEKTTLDNGLKVVTEKVESVKSVSVGIWVKTGSRNETAKQAGITHFLEHMLFKGTTELGTTDWENEKVHIEKINKERKRLIPKRSM